MATDEDHGLRSEIGQAKPFANQETEAYLNVARTNAVLSDENERFMRGYGLTGVLYNVLRILRGAGEPVTCSTIARRMITRVPDVTRLVDRLVERGLVTRYRTEEDRRLVLVGLSEPGRALLAEMDEPVVAMQRRLLGHMTADELAALSGLLVKARTGVGGP